MDALRHQARWQISIRMTREHQNPRRRQARTHLAHDLQAVQVRQKKIHRQKIRFRPQAILQTFFARIKRRTHDDPAHADQCHRQHLAKDRIIFDDNYPFCHSATTQLGAEPCFKPITYTLYLIAHHTTPLQRN